MSFKFELLQEFCAFCRKYGVRCYLQGSLLRAAYEGKSFNSEWDQITVAVTGRGFKRLHRLMSGKAFAKTHPNRALESLLTNDQFPGFYAKYVATDTLHIDFRDDPSRFVNKGLALTIVILVNHPRQIRNVRVIGQYFSDNPITKFLVQHSGTIRRKAFEAYLNLWTSISENSGFYKPQGGMTLFAKGFWKSPVSKPINGVEFPCPKRFVRLQPTHPYYTLDTIHSEFMSFDEFLSLCDTKGIDLKSIYAARQEHRDDYSKKIAAGRKNKRYYNAAFYSTMIRKETSERIAACPVQDLDNEEYLAVIEMYLDQILAQSKNGITPYISYGAFTDAMKVYVQRNNESFHTGKLIMKRLLNRCINRIPEPFLSCSPIVADACYAEEDRMLDSGKMRAEISKEVMSYLK